ncbi:MAG: hypothetical protein Q8M94_17880 [Ignavibacteria bacterium]|nr:hypothetical protein [Ignavibacteria bacterium]
MRKYFLISSLAFLVLSCDLFTTREAENPNQNRSNFETPSSASIVIKNFKNSLIDKNVQNYLACFVDTIYSQKVYSFSASSEALSLYQMEGWGVTEENGYLNAVITKVPKDFPISLTLKDTVYSNLGGDSLIYSASYLLNVPFQTGDPYPLNYGGNLEFKMLRDERSFWVIYFWKDTKSQTLPSWSELKGSFY